jgi:hypothetical protein
MTGKKASPKTARKEMLMAKDRFRFLDYYNDWVTEACWAPDDILNDKAKYHVLKLFTSDELRKAGGSKKKWIENIFERKGRKTYYRYSGGLPYRIDHLSMMIWTIEKLRSYNDQFSMKQIVYLYILLSHYIADAHVPMHCDLRDDKPTRPSTKKPKLRYYNGNYHSKIEGDWEKSILPIGYDMGIFPDILSRPEDGKYTDILSFDEGDLDDGTIKVKIIPKKQFYDYVKNICIQSKERGFEMIPLEDPTLDENKLRELTRPIFADCIGSMISIWAYIWRQRWEDMD